MFLSNPIGTHEAFSSENSAYAPTWQSYGTIRPHGFVVTMKVPLRAIKGGANGVWRVNFRRDVSRTLDTLDWSYGPTATAGSDPPAVDAGTMTGVPAQAISHRPLPRLGLYGLAAMAAKSVGGNTSRVGADLSLPITNTTSLVATVHPDYSNVEVDQQTIAPTAFQRYFNEVRPFFTQLSNYYNAFPCYSCNNVLPLYTTSIPTPRYGYALEGKQGPISFAGFDAVGDGRDDNAQVVSVSSRDTRWSAMFQRAGVSLPAVVDDVDTEGAGYDSTKGFTAGITQMQERGSLVADPAQAQFTMIGGGLYDKTQGFYASLQRIGPQFSPFDGYVANNGLGGYSANYSKTWYRSENAAIPRVLFFAETDLFHSAHGGIGQSDAQAAVGIDLQHVLGLRKLVHLRGQTGSSYVRLTDGNIVPVSQNGFDFTYDYRTATPIALSYYWGRFGPGTLRYWSRSAAFQVTRDVTFDLEADDSDQFLDRGPRNTQWLERASLTWQPGRNTSLALGARRIIGVGPALEYSAIPSYTNAYNISAAFYHRWPQAELYVVYGDASQFTTVPQFIVKLIRYFGAGKGT